MYIYLKFEFFKKYLGESIGSHIGNYRFPFEILGWAVPTQPPLLLRLCTRDTHYIQLIIEVDSREKLVFSLKEGYEKYSYLKKVTLNISFLSFFF